jgi:hypothetical protein
MGSGSYSSTSRHVRAASAGYYTKSAREIFKSRSMNNAMSPHGVKVRESCDSDEHPESLAIVLALDVTGSMHSIPHHLVKKGLPDVMDSIIKKGVEHPQLLFMGIGDHECDEAPLQIGQFESSDELLDKWLTDIWLEGGGGGNDGESYMLAWYFAANHTAIDCFNKRKQKGFLFTVGDEPCLPELPKAELKEIMGTKQPETVSSLELLAKVRERYNVYHLHVMEGQNGTRKEVMDGWKQLLGDNLRLVDNHYDVPRIIADIITGQEGQAAQEPAPAPAAVPADDADDDEEML